MTEPSPPRTIVVMDHDDTIREQMKILLGRSFPQHRIITGSNPEEVRTSLGPTPLADAGIELVVTDRYEKEPIARTITEFREECGATPEQLPVFIISSHRQDPTLQLPPNVIYAEKPQQEEILGLMEQMQQLVQKRPGVLLTDSLSAAAATDPIVVPSIRLP